MRQHRSTGRQARTRNLSWFLFIALVITIMGHAAPVEAAQFQPSFTPADCMFQILPGGLVEGVTVECGYITVPEEYANPDGPTIQLAVAILRSSDPNKKPDPLVMLQGGPGGSTIDTYTQILPSQKRLPDNRDVVLFDQRGTLYSEPALSCPEMLQLSIDTLDQDLSDEESYRLGMKALEDCRARLVSEGVNLNAYNSLENAADVESLRQALGYEQINLYGVSYGTLLALHVMRSHPQGLRSVIIDSVVPTQTNFMINAPKTQDRAFDALFEACNKDSACSINYPNLRDVFYQLVDELNAKPETIQLTDFETQKTYAALFDGDSLMSIIFQMMYNSDILPFLPRVVYEVRGGNWDFVARIASVVVFDRTMSYGMYYSVVCSEDADFTLEDYDLSGLPAQIVAMEDDSAQFILDACKMWNVEMLDPSVDDPVSSDIPTLVLTGAFDPITPPEYAREAAKTLSNSYLVEFPAGAHGAVGSSECADNILLGFLDDPNQAPDTSCVEKNSTIQFSTPASAIELPVLIKLFNLQDGTLPQAVIFIIGLLFLLTALLIYPIVWLARLLQGKPKPAPVANPYDPMIGYPMPAQPDERTLGSAPRPARKPLLYRLAPWTAVAAALSLLVFIVVVIGVAFNLAMANDTTILIGLPGSTRPLFILPVLALIAVIAMFAGALAAWLKGAGSVWGRLYLTLLAFAGLACLAILGIWGMLSVLIV